MVVTLEVVSHPPVLRGGVLGKLGPYLRQNGVTVSDKILYDNSCGEITGLAIPRISRVLGRSVSQICGTF